MSAVEEIVDLPDPAVQPLVHPLDLPPARRQFRNSWLIATLTSPPFGLCVAVIVWFASQNYVAPLLAGAAIIGFGYVAGQYACQRAWDFIPRKRQDRQRPPPLTWEIGAELGFAAVLAAALVLIAVRLGRPDVGADVRAFTVGMAAAVAVLIAVEFIGKVVRYRGPEGRRAWLSLPGVLAVLASVTVSYRILVSRSDVGTSAMLWWGAITMLVVAAGIGSWKRLQARRSSAVEH